MASKTQHGEKVCTFTHGKYGTDNVISCCLRAPMSVLIHVGLCVIGFNLTNVRLRVDDGKANVKLCAQESRSLFRLAVPTLYYRADDDTSAIVKIVRLLLSTQTTNVLSHVELGVKLNTTQQLCTGNFYLQNLQFFSFESKTFNFIIFRFVRKISDFIDIHSIEQN